MTDYEAADFYTNTSLIDDPHAYFDFLRSILATLFMPTRLKALESSLKATSDSLIDEFIADGTVDLVKQYGGPQLTGR